MGLMITIRFSVRFLVIVGIAAIQGCTLRCSDGQSEPEPEPDPEPAPLLLRAPSFEKKYLIYLWLWLAVVITQRLKITQQTMPLKYMKYFECIGPGKGKMSGYVQWLQWLQLGVTFSQVVWLIGC